ncbi:hypothetical protein DS031_18645 [Bacillus taeanensis]|uniref:Uncharacterized protein n=1 Tax=Bacillus taeanensis TaxID=273032 RepID=A0A366XSH7_9BACI|nr:hypothetical protein DS031_18645 [Bacillus taeanensis]
MFDKKGIFSENEGEGCAHEEAHSQAASRQSAGFLRFAVRNGGKPNDLVSVSLRYVQGYAGLAYLAFPISFELAHALPE